MRNRSTGEIVEVPTAPKTEADQRVQQRQWYTLATREAASDPRVQALLKGGLQLDRFGNPVFNFSDPVAGKKVLDEVRRERLKVFASIGAIPPEWVDMLVPLLEVSTGEEKGKGTKDAGIY